MANHTRGWLVVNWPMISLIVYYADINIYKLKTQVSSNINSFLPTLLFFSFVDFNEVTNDQLHPSSLHERILGFAYSSLVLRLRPIFTGIKSQSEKKPNHINLWLRDNMVSQQTNYWLHPPIILITTPCRFSRKFQRKLFS